MAQTQLLFVQPGGPGSTEKARPAMADFAAALALGPIKATYFNRTAEALRHIEKTKPAFGIVSLDFYLAHRKALELVPLARARPGGRSTTTYTLLVRKSDTLRLDGLVGKRITGIHLSDPRFVSAVLLRGRYDAARQLKLIPARSALRAIRAVIRNKADVVLLDQDATLSLKQLPRYASQLVAIHTTAPLPSAPVVRIAGRGAGVKLTDALLRLDKQPKGKTVLKTFKLAGFAAIKPGTYKAVREAYDKWKPAKER